MDQSSDRELVALAQSGDPEAFAALVARWFDPVYDFAVRILRDDTRARVVARETFIRAMGSLGALHRAQSFRSLVFGIARNVALASVQGTDAVRPLAQGAQGGGLLPLDAVAPSRFPGLEAAAEAAALAPVVWQAVARLDARQLSLLDLHLREGLDSLEIAAVLGISPRNAKVLLGRLASALGPRLEALIAIREPRFRCSALDAILGDAQTSSLSPDVRETVRRHTASCAECEALRSNVSALSVFAALTPVAAPAEARAEALSDIMRLFPDGLPQPVRPSGAPPRDGPPRRSDESSTADHRPSLLAWRLGGLTVGATVAASLLLAVLLAPASPFSVFGDDQGSARQSSGGETPGADAPTASPTRPAAFASPGATPSPSPTGFAPASGPATATSTPTSTPRPEDTAVTLPRTSTATATELPTSTATPTPTATAVACAPSLSTNVTTLNLSPGHASSFVLLSSCGTSTFSISGGDGWADASPPTGSVTFGAPLTIVVTAAPEALSEGLLTATLSVVGGNNTVAVTVNASLVGAPPAISVTPVNCSTIASTFAIVASVTDDYAVKSVSLLLTIDGETSEFPVPGPNGTTSGTWELSLSDVAGITAWQLTALDYAGQVASASGRCN